MAQSGHNGHHEDNVNENSQYVFNPMAFNYHQNQVFTPPTVLSQQDANVMADFFNNPDTVSSNEHYLAFGLEPKGDFVTGTVNMDGSMEGDASLANTTISQVTPAHGLGENNMLQPARPPFQSYDFSTVYLPEHQQQQHHQQQQQQQQPQQPQQSQSQPQLSQNTNQQQRQSNTKSGGDAVAGASALIGLSTSQEQSNLLNASNYMTWGNIVGAQTVAGPNRQNGYTPAARTSSGKSNSTSQVPQHLHTPPNQPNSWAEITTQALMQRARHPSLQLDTSAMVPNHQSAWQNAPQSAAPHATKRERPSLVTFGSDSRFGSHGFAGSAQHSPEQKHANLMHLSMAGDVAVPHSAIELRGHQTFAQRHSIAGPLTSSHSTQSSPAIDGLPTPANSIGAATTQAHARKRAASHLDDESDLSRQKHDSVDSPTGKSSSKRRKSSAPHAQFATGAEMHRSQGMSTDSDRPSGSAAPRNRRAAREQKPPRQNLTDEQKRNNHIASEQKRRDAMKTNFEILNRIVPALMSNGAGLSRSEILQHTGNALESTKSGNITIARLLGLDFALVDLQPGSDGEDQDGEGSDGAD